MSLQLMGIELMSKSRWVQLAMCTAVIFFAWCVSSIFEEQVFKSEGFSFGFFATMIQSLTYITLSILQGTRKSTDMKRFALLAALVVGSMGLSKQCLGYITYPVQIIFKSSKIIPVMVIGAALNGKSYSWLEYTCALTLCAGLTTFVLADVAADIDFSLYGIFLVSMSLLCDAFMGVFQERVMKHDQHVTSAEILLLTHMWGLVYFFIVCLATGELTAGLQACRENPRITVALVLASVLTYVGQLAILATIKLFGAVVCVAVTSLRKALTMILSFLIFPKPVTLAHASGLSLIFGSLYLGYEIARQKEAGVRRRERADPHDSVAVEESSRWSNEGASRSHHLHGSASHVVAKV